MSLPLLPSLIGTETIVLPLLIPHDPAGVRVVRCDVRSLDPDAVTVDALARLQLTARRLGREIRLRHASNELVDLIAFMGLADVLLD